MIENILSRLDKVKSRGQDKYIACCPAHADKSPSLWLKQVEDGKVIIKCFAGCSAEEIVASIDLTMSDLFPPSSPEDRKKYAQEKRQRELEKNIDFDRTVLAIANKMRKQGERLSSKDIEQEKNSYLNVRAYETTAR